ncbi:MAG: polymer-forming cytoskeletal protein [Campylobacterota bacterium]|nr:polymer-forming cytoskeletal protein [Campylobacterota bacterium]
MTLSCNLYVDGEFEGIINSQKEVNIGKNGHIRGDVFSKRVVVQGFIDGNVNSTRVEIKAGGRISGSLESSELIIEAKGIFEGNSIIKDSTPKPATEKKQINKS